MLKRNPKYSLGQTIHFLHCNSLQFGKVLAIKVVEELPPYDSTSQNRRAEIWKSFGPEGIKYATVHGDFEEERCFGSRGALVNWLISISPAAPTAQEEEPA